VFGIAIVDLLVGWFVYVSVHIVRFN